MIDSAYSFLQDSTNTMVVIPVFQGILWLSVVIYSSYGDFRGLCKALVRKEWKALIDPVYLSGGLRRLPIVITAWYWMAWTPFWSSPGLSGAFLSLLSFAYFVRVESYICRIAGCVVASAAATNLVFSIADPASVYWYHSTGGLFALLCALTFYIRYTYPRTKGDFNNERTSGSADIYVMESKGTDKKDDSKAASVVP